MTSVFSASVGKVRGLRPLYLLMPPRIEGYWPDYEWLASPDKGFEVKLPPGTFFDGAVIHLVTTSTLDRLGSFSPQSRR